MAEQTYVKRGRRYYPIGEFTGFPADGVWLVRTDRSSHSERRILPPEAIELIPLGDLPDTTGVVASVEQYRDAICKALGEFGDELSTLLFKDGKVAYSMNDVADRIVEAIVREHTKRTADQLKGAVRHD